MAEAPPTRATLLARIKDVDDSEAWAEFVKLYAPVVYGFARKRGLQDADAADMVQDVLRSVARNANRMEYDPKRGTFRGWLYTVTRNKIYNFLSSQKNQVRGSGGDPAEQERLDTLPAREDDSQNDWDLEYERRISAKAMELVQHEFQPSTWSAFWGTAVQGRPAQEVGVELKMTPGAVYVAKSRVLARLRDEVRRLMAETQAW
jgi:RNA polymerase sigma-70 factor (ECF subfamily)